MEIYEFPFGTSDAVAEVCVRLSLRLTFLFLWRCVVVTYPR